MSDVRTAKSHERNSSTLDLFPESRFWHLLVSRWTIIASCNVAWIGIIGKWIMPLPYIITWASQPYSSEQKALLLTNAMTLHRVQIENVDLRQQLDTLSASGSAISKQVSDLTNENTNLRNDNKFLAYQIDLANRSPSTKQLLSGFLSDYPNLYVENGRQELLFGNNAMIGVKTSFTSCHFLISYVNKAGAYSLREGDLDFDHPDVLVNGIVPWKVHLIYWTSAGYCRFQISVLSRQP